MFFKSLVFSPLALACLLISLSYTKLALLAQDSPLPTSSLSPSPISSPIFPPKENPFNLIKNNPFVPKNSTGLNQIPKAPTGPQSMANKGGILQKYLEFKSIAIINKKKYFSILNKRTNKSFWIPENEMVETLRISNYDPASNSITITDGINTETITISAANDTPLNVASATPQPNNEKAVEPPLPNPTNQNNKKSKTPPRRRVIPVKR